MVTPVEIRHFVEMLAAMDKARMLADIDGLVRDVRSSMLGPYRPVTWADAHPIEGLTKPMPQARRRWWQVWRWLR